MSLQGITGVVGAIVIMAVVVTRDAATPRAEGPMTFSEHVAPIVFTNCTPCHRPGEAAPFSLLSYRDVRPLAKAIATATASHVMPPWKAGPSDFPFANARQLSRDQIATIEKWVADGALEGDPAHLPALPNFTEGWQLGPPDLVVTMSEAFEVPARGADVYRNFVVPLNLDRDTWVRAIEFRPSARTAVHHSQLFLHAPGASRQRDARQTPARPGAGMAGRGAAGRGPGLAGLLPRP